MVTSILIELKVELMSVPSDARLNIITHKIINNQKCTLEREQYKINCMILFLSFFLMRDLD